MKSLVLVSAALVVAFSTLGSSCINSPFLVSVNVEPLSGCYPINAGGNLTFGGVTDLRLDSLVDASYTDKIKDARFYDIRVHVSGTYGGTVVGVGYINGIPLLNYGSGANGTAPTLWSNFATPQSLLGSSPYIRAQSAGIVELIRVLRTRPLPRVVLSSNGSLAGQSPVPAGLEVCVEVYAQADAEVGEE
jgi:hypothetical protein